MSPFRGVFLVGPALDSLQVRVLIDLRRQSEAVARRLSHMHRFHVVAQIGGGFESYQSTVRKLECNLTVQLIGIKSRLIGLITLSWG